MIEEKGGSLTKMAYRFSENSATIRDVAALIYGGLKGAGEDKLTFEEVGELVRRTGYMKLFPVATEFLSLVLNGEVDDPEEKKPEADSGESQPESPAK